MTDLIKIEESNSLSRELSSKAIINTSMSQLEKAKISKAERLKAKEKITNLEDKVEVLESKLDKILQLLEDK